MAHSEILEPQQGAQRYVRAAMRTPLLSAEHEHDLAVQWREQGDERALHELTSAYLRLVVALAARYRHYGLPMNDLVQEGNVGLMQAAMRFEPSREVRFSTYAAWWIRAAVQDFVLRNWSIVRTGTTSAQKSLFFNLRRLRARIADLSETSISPANRAEVSRILGVPERDVEQMAARLSANDHSLNATLGTEAGAEWQDFLADEGETPDQIVMHARDDEARVDLVREAMSGLSDRERLIVRERHLLDESMTLEALGARLGVSKERVRQIEGAALAKLKRAVEARVGDPMAAGYLG
jgi:RNA polymerase sigma-32 factor